MLGKNFCVKQAACLSVLLGCLIPHNGFSNGISSVLSDQISWERSCLGEEPSIKDLCFRAVKTGLIVPGIMNVFGKGDRKSTLICALLSSGMVFARDALEKMEPFWPCFCRFGSNEAPVLWGLSAGVISGLSVQHLVKSKKWAPWLGAFTGICCGIAEILLDGKLGLFEAVFRYYSKDEKEKRSAAVEQRMNEAQNERRASIKGAKDAISDDYKRLVRCILQLKRDLRRGCYLFQNGLAPSKNESQENELAMDNLSLFMMDESEFASYVRSDFNLRERLDPKESIEQLCKQYADCPERFQTREHLHFFLIDKFIRTREIYKSVPRIGWSEIGWLEIGWPEIGLSENGENNDDLEAKGEKICECVRKLIELKAGKTREEVLILEEAASNDEPTFLRCDRSEADQELDRLLNKIVSVKSKRQDLQKCQRKYATKLSFESLLALCINSISFVVPAFALSFLPEKIRGSAKDLFFTTFLTILSDGFKDEVSSNVAMPFSVLNTATLATGWNIHTAYRFLKKRLFSRAKQSRQHI